MEFAPLVHLSALNPRGFRVGEQFTPVKNATTVAAGRARTGREEGPHVKTIENRQGAGVRS
jgi:hypothetical protein